MGRAAYKFCKSCGADRDVVGILSHEQLCGECAVRRMERNNIGISTKTGPAFVRQLVGMARYIETAGSQALAQPSPDGHTP